MSTATAETLGGLLGILPGIPFVVFYWAAKQQRVLSTTLARVLLLGSIVYLLGSLIAESALRGRPGVFSLWVGALTALAALGYWTNTQRQKT